MWQKKVFKPNIEHTELKFEICEKNKNKEWIQIVKGGKECGKWKYNECMCLYKKQII